MKRLFLATAAQSVMMTDLIFSWDLQKLQTISYPNKHYSRMGTISLNNSPHLANVSELITELEISGSLLLCWLHAHKLKCQLYIGTHRGT